MTAQYDTDLKADLDTYRAVSVALQSRVAQLELALQDMVEHFATPTTKRTVESYYKTNKQVVAQARAALAGEKQP